MLTVARQAELLDYLKEKKSATVAALSKKLFASEATVRRDLAALEAQGYLKRVHGGAVIGGAPDREIPYAVREGVQERAKSLMAERASAFLHKGDVVFLDGSSSAAHMVEPLARTEDVLVVTSGARTALSLAERGGPRHQYRRADDYPLLQLCRYPRRSLYPRNARGRGLLLLPRTLP